MAFPTSSGWARTKLLRSCLALLMAVVLSGLLGLTSPVQAQGSKQRVIPPKGGGERPAAHTKQPAAHADRPTAHAEHPLPSRAAVVEHLPRGHVTVYMGRNEYYYHHGHYFRRGGGGFITILPPVGLVVPLLPPGYTTVVVAGSPYYYYEGVYYSQAPSGFVVATPPSSVVLPPPATAPVSPYNAISVTAASLNVRSGPGREYNVITIIQRGDIFPVQTSAPGWLYIKLPDGRFGWVEQIFTTPAASAPSG